MKTNSKDNNNQFSRIPILSFFTGGGFLDMGFEMAGFAPVWTNESNKSFAKLYNYGMTNWRNEIYKDTQDASIRTKANIKNISSPKIIKQAFPDGKPKLFGIIGGPPCPDFSTGGKNVGVTGLNGKLTDVYFKRILKIRPTFFVFENVSGLYKTKKHRMYLDGIESKLRKNGYCIDIKVLNALEFGVPQDRDRLFMIGILNNYLSKYLSNDIDLFETDWFPWPINKKYQNAKNKYPWPAMTPNNIDPVKPKYLPLELTVYSVFNPSNCPTKIQNGNDIFKPYSKKISIIKEGDTNRKSFKKLHRYRYSPTACYGNNEVHLHPWFNRRISVREAMRLQGIPDTYTLPENATLTSKFKLVSNGVPVPLANEVATQLFNYLNHR